MFDFLEEQIHALGILEYGYVNPADIEYRQMIRDICAGNSCRNYGTTWACPPAVGTVEECHKRCLTYDKMMVFTSCFFLKDSFDFEGMLKGMSNFKKIAQKLQDLLEPYLETCLVLSNESCNTCKECTYPDTPCRFPKKLHHSIEGYGILVSELAEKTGVQYNNGEGTVTYFGAVLYNEVQNKIKIKKEHVKRQRTY